MNAVTLDTILSIPDLRDEIFEGFLQDPQLSCVSRAFRHANRLAMEQIGKRLTLDDKVTLDAIQAKTKEICESVCGSEDGHSETLTRLYNDVTLQIRNTVLPQHHPQRSTFLANWQKIANDYYSCLYMRAVANADPLTKNRTDRLIVIFHTLKQILWRMPHEEERAIGDFCRESRNFIVREDLRICFMKARSFSATHAVQVHEVAVSDTQRALFEQLQPRSFSVERFRRAHELVFDAESDRNLALSQLWSHIRQRINAGPALNARVADIRAWINDIANQATLNQVRVLRCDLNACPPEIGRLSGLMSLRLSNGAMRTLPATFENLHNLQMLDLSGQRFREIPEVISRLPVLWALNMENNPDLRRMSDTFAQNFLGWRTFLADTLFGSLWFSVVRRGIDLADWRDQHYFSARDQLTEVPFSIWFRDSFSIPHIPLMAAYGTAWAFLNIAEKIIHYCEGFSDWLALPGAMLTGMLISPLVLLTMILLFLDLPIFLFNGLLAFVIEPLVTFVRDELDYDRMVHLGEDVPAQAALA